MKKNKSIYILAILFLAIAFSLARTLQHAPVATKGTGSAYVLRAIDGDTIELSDGQRVRYIGIDTPELRERDGSDWVYRPMPYAEEAKAFNRKLVEGRSVILKFDVQKMDKYNRLLAYVYAGDKMVNLEMVRQGYAMIYTYPPNVKYVEEFLAAQKEARKNNRGLWVDLDTNIIPASEAKENLGLIRMVEADVLSTFLSDNVLILNCRDNFKVAIFRNNLEYFPKEALRSPEGYFKYKTIRVYGVIKDYKGSSEIVLHDPSQLEILE